MGIIRRVVASALVALTTLPSFASHSIAVPEATTELTQLHQDARHIQLAVWMPVAVMMDKVPDATPQQRARVVDALQGFMIFGVVSATFDPGRGVMAPDDPAMLRASARLVVGDRPASGVIPEDDLPRVVRQAAQSIGPALSQTMGRFGGAVQVLVFRAPEDAAPLLDPRKPGELALRLGDAPEFHWYLPLASLLPARLDPDTGDTFPGNFEYSPFTGHRLIVKP